MVPCRNVSFTEVQLEHGGHHWSVELLEGSEWLVAYRFEAQEGYPVIAEARVIPATHPQWEAPTGDIRGYDVERLISGEVTPPPPPGGLTARRLRTLHVSAAVARTRSVLRDLVRGGIFAQGMGYREQVLSEPRQPGSRGRGDAYYARIAAMYVDAVGRGSARPAADVAAELGTYSSAYVRDVVSEARRRGLLTQPPRRGLPGGQLTDRARTALREGD